MSLLRKCVDWIFAEDRRQGARLRSLPLVAFYWDGREPVAHAVLDISSRGMYLLTSERWYAGTEVTVTLQRGKADEKDPHRAISVRGRVVRSSSDGVGLEFIWPRNNAVRRIQDEGPKEADLKTFDSFIKRLKADTRLHTQSGQALIEYILLLPVVFLLVVNLVNFGGFFFAWITVANAARAGADYAILGGASAGFPASPSWAKLRGVITQETSSLPNGSSIVINACQNNQNLTTNKIYAYPGSGSTCGSSVPADPEPTSYVLTSISVSYTYQPFIAAFQFPSLGVYLTLPPTTIIQTASMRSIQ